MQPHLKKCFEGIAQLEFTENLEILGMISSEKEIVPFIDKIYPTNAKVIFFSYCDIKCMLCLQAMFLGNEI